MKKFTITIGLGLLFSLNIFAGGPAPEKHMFKNSSYDINLDLERIKGEVIVHIQSQYLADLEQIIVERSGDNMQNFTACKTIDVASQKIIDGDYLRNSDRFPLPATADVYYRVKTVAKDGVTKTYAPVQLVALH